MGGFYLVAGRLANDIEELSNEAAANFAIRQLKRILPNAAEPVRRLDELGALHAICQWNFMVYLLISY